VRYTLNSVSCNNRRYLHTLHRAVENIKVVYKQCFYDKCSNNDGNSSYISGYNI